MTCLVTTALHAAFHEPRKRIHRVVQSVVWALILLSIAILIAEPLLQWNERVTAILEIADRALLAVFALE